MMFGYRPWHKKMLKAEAAAKPLIEFAESKVAQLQGAEKRGERDAVLDAAAEDLKRLAAGNLAALVVAGATLSARVSPGGGTGGFNPNAFDANLIVERALKTWP